MDVIYAHCLIVTFVGRLKKFFSRERLETVRNPIWLSKKVMVERYDILNTAKW